MTNLRPFTLTMPYISNSYDKSFQEDVSYELIKSLTGDIEQGHLPVCLSRDRQDTLVYVSRDHTIQSFLDQFVYPSFLKGSTLQEVYFMTLSEDKKRYERKQVISQENVSKCFAEILGPKTDVKLFLKFGSTTLFSE